MTSNLVSQGLGILAQIAPTLANMIGGPFAGQAVSAVESALGIAVDGDKDAAMTALAKATPAQLEAVQVENNRHSEAMEKLNIDTKQQSIDEDKNYILDTANARAANAENAKVFWLGITVLSTFATVMVAVLFAAFEILTGGMPIKDASTIAAVFGLIGTVIGYVAANAQQVISFFFGSSKGSDDKTKALSTAIKQIAAMP